MSNKAEVVSGDAFPQNVVPTVVEIAAESDPRRAAVLAAISRVIERRPLTIPVGDFTRKSLAREAGVSRQSLYERHLDLWERFEFLRRQTDTRTTREVELERQLERIKSELTDLRRQKDDAVENARNYRETGEAFARVIAILQEEYRQLKAETDRLTVALERVAGQSPGGTDGTLIVMPKGRRERP